MQNAKVAFYKEKARRCVSETLETSFADTDILRANDIKISMTECGDPKAMM